MLLTGILILLSYYLKECLISLCTCSFLICVSIVTCNPLMLDLACEKELMEALVIRFSNGVLDLLEISVLYNFT